jgi:hypothetical protein
LDVQYIRYETQGLDASIDAHIVYELIEGVQVLLHQPGVQFAVRKGTAHTRQQNRHQFVINVSFFTPRLEEPEVELNEFVGQLFISRSEDYFTQKA